MKKIFVLDTNVMLHNSASLLAFADNEVVIPIEVIEELDEFKKDHDEKGRNAREAIRQLDTFRRKGKLGNGVATENGGLIRVIANMDLSPAIRELGLSPNVADNRILMTAYLLQSQQMKVIFVSKDINARVKADAIGIKAMDFEKEKIDFDKLYTGWRKISMPKEKIDEFYEHKTIQEGMPSDFMPNEFAFFSDMDNEKHTALARHNADKKAFQQIKHGGKEIWSINARNKEQVMAQELLCDDSIKLVTLVGSAGTGKTLLALAAGLQKVFDDASYDRLLISRPIMPLGRDIGYLPGTKEEKLENWMEPIFDNLEFILSMHRKKQRGKFKTINDLLDTGLLQLEALTYMRGRSIPKQFIIIDEAQNLTPHEIKTVITRTGNYAKMVLTGDPYQIDNPYLDSSSNGLTYCVEKMKNQPMFGHVTLTSSERSELASIAAKML
ncbi:MAG: PhoH family protein [Candidatus Omnitrophica bacterium]|nr:PhoH family protein [Candidatus Omnitrophota bacterium]